MCAWTEMVMLQQRGVDCVFRLTVDTARPIFAVECASAKMITSSDG